MTASWATPESRNNCSAAGTRASAKANRSRTVTGAEWWLRPRRRMGMGGVSRSDQVLKHPIGFSMGAWSRRIVKWREQIDAPESEEHEDESAKGAKGEAAATLGEFPAHDDQE